MAFRAAATLAPMRAALPPRHLAALSSSTAAAAAARLRFTTDASPVTRPAPKVLDAARAFSTSRVVAIDASKKTAAAASGSYIKGTVNDPTTYPPPAASHGSYHWLVERGLSVALVPLIVAGTVKHGASGLLDGALALTLVVHSHIGFDCILADYLHKRKFPVAGPLASWTLRAATLGTIVGLYEFQTNDIGLTELVARVWAA